MAKVLTNKINDLLKRSVEKDLHNIKEAKNSLENLKSMLPEEVHYDFDNIENGLRDLESFLSDYSNFIPIIEGIHGGCFTSDEDKMIITLRISCEDVFNPVEYCGPMIESFAKNTLWFLNKVLNQPVFVVSTDCEWMHL